MNVGSSDHRTLVEKGRQYINKREESECIESQTEYEPDLCIDDSSLCESGEFEEVWFEAEVSTVRRPSNIVNKIVQAAKSDAKIVFLVPAVQDKRIDYFANRIDNIIGPPSLRSHYAGENKYCLYKSSNPLKTHEGELVLTERNGMTDWIYNDKEREIRYETDEPIVISNPRDNISVDETEVSFYGEFNDDGLTVKSSNNTESYESIQSSPYNVVNEPVYPFSIPRNRIEKVVNSVEYLIFGDNVTYHRVHPKLESYIDGLD